MTILTVQLVKLSQHVFGIQQHQNVIQIHVQVILKTQSAKLIANASGLEMPVLLTNAIKIQIQLLVELTLHVIGLALNAILILVLLIQMIQPAKPTQHVNGMDQNVKSNVSKEQAQLTVFSIQNVNGKTMLVILILVRHSNQIQLVQHNQVACGQHQVVPLISAHLNQMLQNVGLIKNVSGLELHVQQTRAKATQMRRHALQFQHVLGPIAYVLNHVLL